MRYLLDVNVLIALIDSAHVRHRETRAWFETTGQEAWATCPLTENGVLRIVGHPNYPKSPGTPAAVAETLRPLCELPGHEFWPDSLSLLNTARVQSNYLSSHAQVTDTYLLSLARAHDGKLATFDRQLVTTAVLGGKQALQLIG